MAPDSLTVTVQYTGKEDYRETVHGDPTFTSVKLKAIHHFGLEPSAASNYVLQKDGIDLADGAHLSTLNVRTVTLVLTLKREPEKG